MAIPFLAPIDLNKNELLNAVIQNLAAPPSSPFVGQIYYHTGDLALYLWDGSVWLTWLRSSTRGAASGVASLNASSKVIEDPANAVAVAAAGRIPLADINGKIDTAWLKTGSGNGLDADTLDAHDTAYFLARANHTGTQLASTISDFDTQVRTSRLDQMAAPTGSVSLNGQKITNLADPTGALDGVTKQYVDNLIQGVDAHPSVRAATTADIALTGAATVDTVVLATNDRILVKNQTAPAENGIYVVNTAGAWTRALDADTWNEYVAAYVWVEEGGQGDTGWLSTANAGGTLNTTAIPWVQFASAGEVTAANAGTGASVFISKTGITLNFRKINAGSTKVTVTENANDISIDVAEGNINVANLTGTLAVTHGGTGATTAAAARTALGVPGKFAASVGNGSATAIAVTHSLGTTDVIVQVKEVAGGLAVVYPEIVITDANNVTVTFTVAPTTNQYRVIVIG